MGLEVPINQIGPEDEGILGDYVGSFDGMTYGKIPEVLLPENILNRPGAEMVGSGCGPWI